jgi:hypothetical protein
LGFWDYLDARGARREESKRLRFDRIGGRPGFCERILPGDFRGWLGYGLFLQSSGLFAILALKPELAGNQGFMTLAAAVIVSGWVGGAAAFAYSAGKGNSEMRDLAASSLRIAEASQPQPDKPDVILEPGETAQAQPAEPP